MPEYPAEFVYGCSCSGIQCKDPSQCLCTEDLAAKDRKSWPYSPHGTVIRKDNCLAIVECNSKCSCGVDCTNRNVQKGRKVPLEIFMTAGKGWGMYQSIYSSGVTDKKLKEHNHFRSTLPSESSQRTVRRNLPGRGHHEG